MPPQMPPQMPHQMPPQMRFQMPHHRHVLSIPFAVALATIVAGCQTKSDAELRSMNARYHAGDYASAHRRADDLAAYASGQTRDEAMYLSGLSAYRMGDLEDAERRLLVAAQSRDASTAANAKASLGLIRLDQGRPREAARLFEEASAGLSSEDDLDRASKYADAAERQAAGGMPWLDRTADETARGTGARSTSRSSSHATPEAGEFSLQIGAFRERRRAERAADEASRAGDRIGTARVVRRTRNGRVLYVVQIGRFDSRHEAAKVRDRMKRSEYIVAPML